VIKKQVLKVCCGGKSVIFHTQTAVKKPHIQAFEKAGYATLPHFYKAGLFYVQKGGLNATSSFGSTKVQVRCSDKYNQALDDFEQLLDKLTSK